VTEAKLIATLVGIIAIIAFVGWAMVADYEAGKHAGEALVQTEFDKFKSDSTAAANKALATVTKERDDAIANNEAVTNDLQAQLSATQSSADSLVKRVSDYQTQLRASSDALRQASSDKDAAIASGIAASQSRLTQALTAYDSACQRDAIRLNKLTTEISPQL
jgi:hypothetical protein